MTYKQVTFRPERGIVVRYISEAEATEHVIPPYQVLRRTDWQSRCRSHEFGSKIVHELSGVAKHKCTNV